MSDTYLDRLIAQIQDNELRAILSAGTSDGKDIRGVYVEPAIEKLAKRIIALEKGDGK